LYRPVAPAEVVHGQLMHFVEMSRRPNITVQVLPYSAGGHIGLMWLPTSAVTPLSISAAIR
jgi:hypothetical protein